MSSEALMLDSDVLDMAAFDALLEDPPEWCVNAQAWLPEHFDLSLDMVRNGFLVEWASPRGLFWDILSEARSRHDAADIGYLARAFEFASDCLHSGDADLFNPAAIGFYCKVAGNDGMPLEALPSFMGEADFAALKALFEHHYGVAETQRMGRLIGGKGRH